MEAGARGGLSAFAHSDPGGSVPHSAPHKIPKTFREAPLAAGLTQQQLAELAQCSIAYVRLIEAGYRPARSVARARLLRVLSERGYVRTNDDERPAATPGAREDRQVGADNAAG